MSTYTLVQLYNPESSGSSGIQEFWYPYTKKAGVLDLITFPGATSTTTGSEGLVPSAAIGDRNKYLRGDGKWADPPTGSGGGLQYEFTLNGSTYSGSTLSGDSGIYAPTASGGSTSILMGGAGSVPAWYTPPTNITGSIRYNGSSWTFDSASYVPMGYYSFRYQDYNDTGSTEFAQIGAGTIPSYMVLKAGSGISLTAGAGAGAGHGTLLISATGGGAGSIAAGTGLSLTNSTMSLEAANANTIGGVRVIGSYNVSTGTNYSSTGIRFPLALSATEGNRGFVGIPLAAAGTDGLLTVAADHDDTEGYLNNTDAVAVPVFYGTIQNMQIYKGTESGTRYSRDVYEDGDSFTGHYVNVRDIVNGIVKHEIILQILAEALGVEIPKR